MTETFNLRIETPKHLNSFQELGLLRAAVARRPTAHLKRRLAGLSMAADAYDEAIPLLEDCAANEPDPGTYCLLATSLLAKENEPSTHRARDAARKAVELSLDEPMRAAALATLGKALVRLGDVHEAKDTFEAAWPQIPSTRTRASAENSQRRARAVAAR